MSDKLAARRRALKDTIFAEIVRLLGALGTCDRAQVGALIVLEGRCISWGYNGAPPGIPHCGENLHGYRARLEASTGPDPRSIEERAETFMKVDGCANATHAEANALAFAARQGISTEGATLYVGVSPCTTCSRLIIAAGISKVIALSLYRDASGVELLEEAGIDFRV